METKTLRCRTALRRGLVRVLQGQQPSKLQANRRVVDPHRASITLAVVGAEPRQGPVVYAAAVRWAPELLLQMLH